MLATRKPHKLEVVGSNPAPATNLKKTMENYYISAFYPEPNVWIGVCSDTRKRNCNIELMISPKEVHRFVLKANVYPYHSYILPITRSADSKWTYPNPNQQMNEMLNALYNLYLREMVEKENV